MCFRMKGRCSSMISSVPRLAWKLDSMSSKMAIEPSAPPPLFSALNRQRRVHHRGGERRNPPELASGDGRAGDTDGVVEGQTKGLVDLLTALAAVEEVLLEEVAHAEQRAAGSVGGSVHAIWAGDTPGDRSCIVDQSRAHRAQGGRSYRWQREQEIQR